MVVARGLRITQDFAGFFRGECCIYCVFRGECRFPKPLVGGSTPPAASTCHSTTQQTHSLMATLRCIPFVCWRVVIGVSGVCRQLSRRASYSFFQMVCLSLSP